MAAIDLVEAVHLFIGMTAALVPVLTAGAACIAAYAGVIASRRAKANGELSKVNGAKITEVHGLVNSEMEKFRTALIEEARMAIDAAFQQGGIQERARAEAVSVGISPLLQGDPIKP